ncbi:hypothetical protein B0H16DRAFT_1454875 [Mycena metata]|uniref:Uncharacterized protein n=1 Tax=Mycena metata TaxID=1033252 RepID=A0AAD7NJC1_9AGAR|nr:hypothetical protein B0H16DRAFT_1454875 [Mycena metata]
MKQSNSLVPFLAFVLLVVCSVVPAQGASTACKAADRVLVETRTVTASGHEFQVSTKACSADVLALSNSSQSQPRALERRQSETFNTCGLGASFNCVVNEGTGPLEADCVALSNAIVAAFEGPGRKYHPPYSSCTSLNLILYLEEDSFFAVPPQFVQEFSLGTCLWAYINENPAPAGAVLEECYSILTQEYSVILNEDCIVNGDTGGFLIPEPPIRRLFPQLWTGHLTLSSHKPPPSEIS